MNGYLPTRRQTLQQLVGLTALGAVNLLRAPRALAADAKTAIPGFKGQVIGRQDADYEIWRQSMVWHMSKPSRKPDLIVQAHSDADVVAAVKYAAQKKLKVAVRSGGHNSSWSAVRDGGICIDMSAMDTITIDKAAQIASIQSGVRSFDLVTTARDHGLSFPVPHCPSVGLGGFTMGGGMGWNWAQRGGFSTLSIQGAEVVLADGSQVKVGPKENPDLYWALRGVGPGFFGVVTKLDLALYPAPKAIMASNYIFPIGDLPTVMAAMDEVRKKSDVSRVELITVLMHHPEAPADAPPDKSKICFFSAFVFEADEAAARKQLEPFAQSALAAKAVVKKEYMPFNFEGLYEHYFSLNDPAGRCARYKVDNVLTNDGGKCLMALAEHFKTAHTRDYHILSAFNLHLKARPDSCLSADADSFIGCYAIWDDEKDDPKAYDWLKKTLPLMDPFAVGHYINEIEATHPDRYRKCFSEQNWKRLQDLRQKYDPHGVFHNYLGVA